MSFISENFGDAIDHNDDYFYYDPEPLKGDICPTCNGSGEGQNENQKCGNCKGSGEV